MQEQQWKMQILDTLERIAVALERIERRDYADHQIAEKSKELFDEMAKINHSKMKPEELELFKMFGNFKSPHS